MAGHSKWANIKHRKAAQDAKRGQVFTKLIRELTVAAKGGAAPEDNPRLRTAMDKALAANMKKDTIDKAIARGVGAGEGDNYEECTYEGYGVNGVAILVECMTDNKNRTVSDVRHAFTKRGGNLGTDGSVAYLFSRKGQITFEPGADEDRIMEVALEAGAEDIQTYDDTFIEVTTTFEDYLAVKDAMVEAGLEFANAEVTMIPSTTIPLNKDETEKTLSLVDMLEELDDVQNVYTNADFPDEVMGEE